MGAIHTNARTRPHTNLSAQLSMCGGPARPLPANARHALPPVLRLQRPGRARSPRVVLLLLARGARQRRAERGHRDVRAPTHGTLGGRLPLPGFFLNQRTLPIRTLLAGFLLSQKTPSGEGCGLVGPGGWNWGRSRAGMTFFWREMPDFQRRPGDLTKKSDPGGGVL